MEKFCPLIKDMCKKADCVLWVDECLILSYLKNSSKEPIALGFEDEEDEEPSVPNEIQKLSADELGEKILCYVKKELTDENAGQIDYGLFSEYWDDAGVENKFSFPGRILAKMNKAEKVARKKWEEEIKEKSRARYEKEKADLPQLIQDCVNWARQNNLVKVTKSDISTFLLEKNAEVLSETKTMLYSKANVQLKELLGK